MGVGGSGDYWSGASAPSEDDWHVGEGRVGGLRMGGWGHAPRLRASIVANRKGLQNRTKLRKPQWLCGNMTHCLKIPRKLTFPDTIRPTGVPGVRPPSRGSLAANERLWAFECCGSMLRQSGNSHTDDYRCFSRSSVGLNPAGRFRRYRCSALPSTPGVGMDAPDAAGAGA